MVIFRLALLVSLAFTTTAKAQCVGQNLINALPAVEAAELHTQVAKVPFASGNLWRATKGNQVITLVGTYHFDDPRHAATLATVTPLLDPATQLLVEAGPTEQAALKAKLATDPTLLIENDGPTMREALPVDVWQTLSKAAEARGVPPFMLSKFRPWYVSILLSVPPCQASLAATARGLDGALMDRAAEMGIPVLGLEPFDTVFQIFGNLPYDEQLGMITTTLAMEEQSQDMAITLADTYFDQESRLIWEYSKQRSLALPGYTAERVTQEFALIEENLMSRRNRAWIPVIEAAATRGPTFVGFGALHLSGKEGVLALLAAQGYALERLSIAAP